MITAQKRLGQYYTKPEVVSAMLDMIGYRIDEGLYKKRMLEPSTGDGAFLKIAISRLIQSVNKDYSLKKLNEDEKLLEDMLKDSFRAIEVDRNTHKELLIMIAEQLKTEGINESTARRLSEHWIINDDFLSWNLNINEKFNFIIGNPPYIRIENMDLEHRNTYKNRFTTLFDRADIYVAFIEHGLNMLTDNGILSYICTDRFTKNNYGKKIRLKISQSYRVKYFVDLSETQPFLKKVSAYPCILGIDMKHGKESLCIKTHSISECEIKEIIDSVVSNIKTKNVSSHLKKKWFENDEPWIMDFDVIPILEKIQALHPSIKQSPLGVKCKVGVATGLNDVFLVTKQIADEYKLEKDLLIPIITKDHIKTGKLQWDGKCLINTFDKNKQAINLDDYPNTKKYLELYKTKLENRAFVKKHKTGSNWFFTQEKVRFNEIVIPKLVFPDIASKARIIIENGHYYPEHSLYYVIPGEWDIKILKIILESPIGLAFVKAYSTKMNGGYSRYQKQSVEKICLPAHIEYSDEMEIHETYKSGNYSELNLMLAKLYGLSSEEIELLTKYVNI